MHIRRAAPEDASLLAHLNRHVHDPHVAAEPHVYRVANLEELTAWFRERLGGEDVVLIADDGEPLGYLMARIVNRPAHLFAHARHFFLVDQLAVNGTFRRKGVGRALMAAAEQLALESGLDTVELDVRAANGDALAFYTALGYHTDSFRLRRRLPERS